MLFEYETKRLVLKILKPDAANSQQVLDFYMRDKELFERFEPDRVPQFYTAAYQKNVLRCEYNLAVKASNIRFYVYLKGYPGVIIGTVCFHNITPRLYSCCEVGYKFSSLFQHQGYAAEAVTKGIEIMFSELQLHRIMAWVLPDNEPSIRLLESLNFKLEGISREYLYMHGQWTDHAQYSLISPISDYISSEQSQ